MRGLAPRIHRSRMMDCRVTRLRRGPAMTEKSYPKLPANLSASHSRLNASVTKSTNTRAFAGSKCGSRQAFACAQSGEAQLTEPIRGRRYGGICCFQRAASCNSSEAKFPPSSGEKQHPTSHGTKMRPRHYHRCTCRRQRLKAQSFLIAGLSGRARLRGRYAQECFCADVEAGWAGFQYKKQLAATQSHKFPAGCLKKIQSNFQLFFGKPFRLLRMFATGTA